MRVLVFGSANIDHVYAVDHFVKPGETLSADHMNLFCGGKGFNQAIAFARAGCDVYFAGAIGPDGNLLRETLTANGVNTDNLKIVQEPSGHSVIQVTPDGQNSIIILGGANEMISGEDAARVISSFSEGDLVVLQNEISSVGCIIDLAKQRKMITALNPSPFNEKILTYDLSKVDYLILNEVEGKLLTGRKAPKDMINVIHEKYPDMNVLLTLGSAGSVYADHDGNYFGCGVYPVDPVDTTAAGDTFTGYFLSEALAAGDIEAALKKAAAASGIAVSRAGASQSIPDRSDISELEISRVGSFSGVF